MRKARILYVDDEVGAARLLKLNLEATGRYEIRVQNWPEDALATARGMLRLLRRWNGARIAPPSESSHTPEAVASR